MISLRKLGGLAAVVALLSSAGLHAAGGAGHQEAADIDPGNVASLQRGARNFMNYCSGCHSAQYVRFSTIGKYLELSEDQLIDNLMFNADKTFETIRSSMPPAEAARWYGTAPPDLSLMARAKGADYVYSFLKGFYVDPDSPTGVNNIAMPNTAMPHVLWELQGYQSAEFDQHVEVMTDGTEVTHAAFSHFEPVTEGRLGDKDYDDFVRDTVNFLAYIAEPIRADRRKLGTWVLIYLVVFLVVARMLKKQIWKDVK